MLLRSNKSLNSQLDFDSCCIQQSKFIQAGGLWLPSNCQKVSEESYLSLAEINALGFLTVDSVDYTLPEGWHEDNVPVKVGIHPTVSGFMRSETLSRIKEKMNIPKFILPESDKKTGILLPNVCVIHHIIMDEVSDEDWGRMILPVNYYRIDNRGYNESFTRLFWKKDNIQGLKKDIKLNIDEPVEFVTFIDMKRNNPTNEEYGLFSQLILALKNSKKVGRTMQSPSLPRASP
jgi:hypothetical protein